MSPKDIVQSYYDSLIRKDNKWQDLWAADAVFADASGSLNAQGKAAVIQSFIPFIKGVAGLKIKQMIIEGDDVCVIVSYDYVNSKGDRLNQDDAEVWNVKDGKLAKLILYFDITAYRSFIRA